ncbi:hypothetical protein GC089_17000 [Cellulomonas sp. JZ18]|uniref:hypothetical protein n=1 Tax=Cellulomonas sp. JZ18 TaxID=2654191 RepID=UPI0012D4336E|nr:hypothetical protein [Cellulomonas sp. JZ18]QGQ20573.1 hypothetical protein GC089_17000 [Cellulomonas sp. JZ18]
MPATTDDDDVLVLRALHPGASDPVAGTFDRVTGLLTPTRRTWRIRPVLADDRAYVTFVVHRRGVDLALDRFNGWRRARVPLVRVHRQHQASQSAEVVRELAADLRWRRVRDHGSALELLADQARWLEDGREVRTSPLTALPRGGGFGNLPITWP